MTDHAHHYLLDVPGGRVVEGRCPCGAVKQFPAFIPAQTSYRTGGHGFASPAQREESTTLMSHARSLVVEPR